MARRTSRRFHTNALLRRQLAIAARRRALLEERVEQQRAEREEAKAQRADQRRIEWEKAAKEKPKGGKKVENRKLGEQGKTAGKGGGVTANGTANGNLANGIGIKQRKARKLRAAG